MYIFQHNFTFTRWCTHGVLYLLTCYAVQGQVELVEDFERYALGTSLDKLSRLPGSRWQSNSLDASKIGLATAPGGGHCALQLDTLGETVRFMFDDVAVSNQLTRLDLHVKWTLFEELPLIKEETAITALAVNSDYVICAYLARSTTEKGWVAFRNGHIDADTWSLTQIVILGTNSVGHSQLSFKVNGVLLEDEAGCVVFDSLLNATVSESKNHTAIGIRPDAHGSILVLLPSSLNFIAVGEFDNLLFSFQPRTRVAVDTTPVTIPYSWLARYYGVQLDDSVYTQVALRNGANQRPLWESYVAGLDPTNAASAFQMHISHSNGIPCLGWSPHHPDRTYTIFGKTNLNDAAWHSPTNSGSRFFKVNATLP